MQAERGIPNRKYLMTYPAPDIEAVVTAWRDCRDDVSVTIFADHDDSVLARNTLHTVKDILGEATGRLGGATCRYSWGRTGHDFPLTVVVTPEAAGIEPPPPVPVVHTEPRPIAELTR